MAATYFPGIPLHGMECATLIHDSTTSEQKIFLTLRGLSVTLRKSSADVTVRKRGNEGIVPSDRQFPKPHTHTKNFVKAHRVKSLWGPNDHIP